MRHRQNAYLPLISDKGLTLVEVIMTMGVMAFVATLTGSLYLQMQQSKQRTDLTSQLNFLREQYTNIITNELAWNNTIFDPDPGNPMKCLTDATDCVPMTVPIPPLPQGYRFSPQMIKPDGYAGPPIRYLDYDPVKNPNDGFAKDGSKCTGWIDGVPNLACPIRVDFIWQPLCPADPSLGCDTPESEITIFFRIQLPETGEYAIINSGNYTRTIRRKGSLGPKLLFACPNPTDVVTGFDFSGQPICKDGASVKP